MKLTETVIYGFGKFYQKTLHFQDGIHVIYGPNEAGKSTLHTFLGCMLFGLDRGRGRAARSDLYSRYLPWNHDATYGGALTLESEEQTYHIQRSFRAERRSCLLSAGDQMPAPCSEDTLAKHCHEGLTESLYYNTISVRSLGCAPDTTLAQELTRQLTDLQQTGNDTIPLSGTLAWLRTQRKQQEALLTPDLDQQILTKRRTLEQLEQRLQNTTFQERKAMLQMEMDDCLEQLAVSAPNHRSRHSFGRRSDHRPDPTVFSPPRHAFLSLMCVLILAAATVWLWTQQYTSAAIGTGALAGLLLLLRILRRPHRHMSDPDEGDEEDAFSEEEIIDDSEPDSDPANLPTQRLRRHLEALQQQYETVCRQEWDHDRLLEQAQSLEEELEQLTLRQAKEAEIRLEIQAITLAASTLQNLSQQMQDDVGPRLAQEMSRILNGLTDGAYTRVFVDGQLRVSVQTAGPCQVSNDTSLVNPLSQRTFRRSSSRIVPLESLSRGTIELIYLAMRLAVIDLLFPQGGMPLILDDCFLAYDDDRLAATLSWLAENYSGQVLIFTCQKREAALLQKEQIPFTHIILS